MQMYPKGGHTQHCYTGVADDEDCFTMDDPDYHYNNNNNAFAHQRMQNTLDKGVPHKKQNYTWDNNFGKDEYHYKNSSTVQMKPNHQWMPPQKHDYNYNHMHGYGGYDQNFGPDDWNENEEEYETEDWYESKEEYDTWNGRNDHFGLGKHQNANKYSGMPYGVEKSSGYGPHQGSHMPVANQHPYRIPAAPPQWQFKGVKD